MGEFEVADAKGRRTVSIDATTFSIGRSSDNQLQLSDAQVSRRHAEVSFDDGVWKIHDCGSRFGTFVNDQRIETTTFGPGDRLRIGQTEIRLADAGNQSSVMSSGAFDFRQVNALLAGLRALGSSGVLDEVLAIVLDSALDLTGAERGFILLANSSRKLELKLARARGGISLPSAQTSQRIPDEVFNTGVDRIVTDLLDEAHAAFHAGTVALGIRHVMCTPLKVVEYGSQSSDKRIGVLYLDSRERGYLQQAGALHALAAEAAVVIENARLYREVVDKERAAQELRIAAEIQQALLPPPFFTCASIELVAVSTPCRAVGGDFFDYLGRPNGDITFSLGDVAGKGTSAALLTAVVQGLFAAEGDTDDLPDRVLTRVNKTLCRRAIEARFVTAFYGHIIGRTLRYCNAGHNPPLLISSGGLRRLDVGGSVLGLFDHGMYEAGEVPINPGDLLVIFSDGVTEAENEVGEEFGEDRLAACIAPVRERQVADVLDAIQNAIKTFCGTAPTRDDVTLMLVRSR